ncbi:hypothetical protein HPB47_004153 [Ixodes persulcatus]|uniref:Uncharacterized protein n=1 Tax=Ixodes persulcatus TaxID=34615 RepID=A0AC60PHG1_IXOPE|nr:hypothetical protein HPB47_004153 [Ixodes persulcatus]
MAGPGRDFPPFAMLIALRKHVVTRSIYRQADKSLSLEQSHVWRQLQTGVFPNPATMTPPQGAPVKAGVWRVASPRTSSHAGSPAHVWLCVAFPGEKGILVVQPSPGGLAPPSEPRPFQVPSGNREAVARPRPTKKPEVAACPPPQRGGFGAPPTQRDRLSNDMPALITRSPPRRKERAPRPKPLEEPSTSKEQQAPPAASAVSPEEERMDVSESPPIRSAPPDDSKLKKSSQKKPIPRVTPPKPPEGV